MGFLGRLFGMESSVVDFKGLIEGGAMIVDVRTREEYADGGLKNSVNIPLDRLGSSLERLPKDRAIILYCASGMRSSAACSLLKRKGYSDVYNGKSASYLRSMIR
ncbi:MAG: rhodanese-like domain-containing protein [Bacteroidales bacterium]